MTYKKHFSQRKLFNANECRDLIALANTREPKDYAITGEVHQEMFDLPNTRTTSWLYDLLFDAVMDANSAYWEFDINRYQQELRVSRYHPGYYHDWHLDYTTEDRSKIAVSVVLNDDYEGGEFKLLETEFIKSEVGYATIFPAFIGHKVEEVTKGERWVLLAWFTGDDFR